MGEVESKTDASTEESGAKVSGRAVAAFVLGLLSLACSCIAGVPAALVGWSALRQIEGSNGSLSGKGMAIIGIMLGLGSTALTLAAAVWVGTEYRGMTLAQRNLKMIGIALHNYNDTHKAFPLTGIEFDQPDGAEPQRVNREMLSWRVRLLPYLDVDGAPELYKQFNFHKPWDSPQNKALVEKMPDVFATPGKSSQAGMTRIQAVVFPRDPEAFADVDEKTLKTYGRSTAFDQTSQDLGGLVRHDFGAATFSRFRDGASNCLLVVEADEPVVWTKPDDWELHLEDPLRGLGELRFGGFFVVFADGAVRLLPKIVDGETLIRLSVINDREPIDIEFN